MLKYTWITLFVLLAITANITQANSLWDTYNRAIIEQHIVPKLEELHSAAKQLDNKTNQFCQTPTTDTLNILRHAYFAVNDAWMGIQHMRRGPIDKDRRFYRIQLYPDKRNAVGKQLLRKIKISDASQLVPDKFPKLTVAIQGISALEQLLFRERYPISAFQSNDQQRSYHCQLLQAISANLVSITKNIHHEFTETKDIYDLLVNAKRFPVDESAPDLALQKRIEVSATILNSYYTQLDTISTHKLGMPLGKSLEKARPKRSESTYSQRSLHNIKLNLLALEQIYEITYSPLLELQPESQALNKKIKQLFSRIHQQINNIGMPLEEAVKNATARKMVIELQSSIDQLHTITLKTMASTLGLPLRFNSLDGD